MFALEEREVLSRAVLDCPGGAGPSPRPCGPAAVRR